MGLLLIKFHVEPLLVEYSKLIKSTLVEFQVIDLNELANQFSPPLGLVSEREVIKKLSLVSEISGTDERLILMLAVAEGVFGIGFQL